MTGQASPDKVPFWFRFFSRFEGPLGIFLFAIIFLGLCSLATIVLLVAMVVAATGHDWEALASLSELLVIVGAGSIIGILWVRQRRAARRESN